MVPLKRLLLPHVLKPFDLLAVVVAFVLAATGAWPCLKGVPLIEFFGMRVSVGNFALFLGLLAAFHALFHAFGLYALDRRMLLSDEIALLAKATTVGSLVLLAASFAFDISVISGQFLVLFWALALGALAGGRAILRLVLAPARPNGTHLRHLVIVGTNGRAVRFADKVKREPELGYRLVGFAEDGAEGRSPGFAARGYAVVTQINALAGFLQDRVVDEVLICLPLKSYYDQISQIVHTCEAQGIVVQFPSDFFSLKLARSRAERLGADTVVTIYTGAMTGFPVLVKRLLDICLASVVAVATAPILLVIAILIKATSRGPILFLQDRVGLNKRRFRMCKFRTMVQGAEKMLPELEHLNEAGGPVFKMRKDPRVTKVGKFLRKTSLDELPQIFNVLKGDMSLVGPRPLPVRDYKGFEKDCHRRRFSVRPGMTCSWQVNGRSTIPFDRWMELDLEYIDCWSLWLDLKILAKTVPAVFKKVGAV